MTDRVALVDELASLIEDIGDTKAVASKLRRDAWHGTAELVERAPAIIAALRAEAEPVADAIEAETMRYMRELAQGMGYESTLEALEDLERFREAEPVADDGYLDAVILEVVEEAQQACRYLGKHNSDAAKEGPYLDGFQDACDLLGTTPIVAEHVQRHRDRIIAAVRKHPPTFDQGRRAGIEEAAKFQLGDRVTKTKGSSWTGLVVGFYSTSLTPIGYAVESENEPGSVQIYPESALTTKEQGA